MIDLEIKNESSNVKTVCSSLRRIRNMANIICNFFYFYFIENKKNKANSYTLSFKNYYDDENQKSILWQSSKPHLKWT